MITHSQCPLCNSSATAPFLSCTDYFLSGEIFELSKCPDCGFVFTRDHPGEDEIGRYYESKEYISHNDAAQGISAKLYRIAREFMLKRKSRMTSKGSGISQGKLLDIGSGTGHFLSVMKKNGWEVTGIEINQKARQLSMLEFGLDVISPNEIRTIPSGSVDAVTMWHVLEHFQDPFTYMSEVARMLKPGGVCLIALPNCNSSDAIHYREFWAAWDVPRHLWHFTPDTFRKFAEKCGFSVKSAKALPLDMFYISILSEKYKGSKLPVIRGLFSGLWLSSASFWKKSKASSLVYTITRGEN